MVIGGRPLPVAVVSNGPDRYCLFSRKWRHLHGCRRLRRPHHVVGRRAKHVGSQDADGYGDEEHAKCDRWHDSRPSLALLRHGHHLKHAELCPLRDEQVQRRRISQGAVGDRHQSPSWTRARKRQLVQIGFVARGRSDAERASCRLDPGFKTGSSKD